MKQQPFLSPWVRDFETDLSDKTSIYSQETPKQTSQQPNTGGNPVSTDAIIIETGFYLLQEDNNKILI